MLHQVTFTDRDAAICVAVIDDRTHASWVEEIYELADGPRFIIARGLRPMTIIDRQQAPADPTSRGEQLLSWYETQFSHGTNTDVSTVAAISDLLHALEADYKATGDWDHEDPDALDSVLYVLEAARNAYLEER